MQKWPKGVVGGIDTFYYFEGSIFLDSKGSIKLHLDLEEVIEVEELNSEQFSMGSK